MWLLSRYFTPFHDSQLTLIIRGSNSFETLTTIKDVPSGIWETLIGHVSSSNGSSINQDYFILLSVQASKGLATIDVSSNSKFTLHNIHRHARGKFHGPHDHFRMILDLF